MRRSSQRPLRAHELVGREIRAGFHEALLVEDDTAIQPPGVWNRAGHDEDVADIMSFDFAFWVAAPSNPFKPAVSLQVDDLCPRVENDCGVLLDAANQIA